MLSKAAAIQYAPDKIRVNSIHPGIILTPMLDIATTEELQPFIDATPLKRGAQPEEVGVHFFLRATKPRSSPAPNLRWTAATPRNRRGAGDAR
jgi:NAD(P)-dependent dehydrogenase (short-subunit alcohol dehydrogenase family)